MGHFFSRMKSATQANVVSYAALATTNLIMSSNTQNINDKIQFLSSYPNMVAKNADHRQDRDSRSPNKNSPTFEKHDFLKVCMKESLSIKTIKRITFAIII